MKYKGGLHKCFGPIGLDKLKEIIKNKNKVVDKNKNKVVDKKLEEEVDKKLEEEVEEEVTKHLDHKKKACSNFEKNIYILIASLILNIKDGDNEKLLHQIDLWLFKSQKLYVVDVVTNVVKNLRSNYWEYNLNYNPDSILNACMNHYKQSVHSVDFNKIILDLIKQETDNDMKNNLYKYLNEEMCPQSIDVLSITTQEDMDVYLAKTAITCFYWRRPLRDIISKNKDHKSIGFVRDWMNRVRNFPGIPPHKTSELFERYDELYIEVFEDFTNFIQTLYGKEKSIEEKVEDEKQIIDEAAKTLSDIVNDDKKWNMVTNSNKSSDDKDMLYNFYMNYNIIYYINLRGVLTTEPFDEFTINKMKERFR